MHITLKGNPYSTNNIYFHKGNRAFIKSLPKAQKDDYYYQAYQQWKKPLLTRELEIEIYLFFGDKRKRDWDNYHKLAMDALAGVVWKDDSQIKKSTVIVGYDKKNPRIEIEIL